jgi:hypothetical protein
MKKTTSYGIEKKFIYSTYSPLSSTHFVLTSLSHPRKILLVVPQIGKQEIGEAKDLSAPLRMKTNIS